MSLINKIKMIYKLIKQTDFVDILHWFAIVFYR